MKGPDRPASDKMSGFFCAHLGLPAFLVWMMKCHDHDMHRNITNFRSTIIFLKKKCGISLCRRRASTSQMSLWALSSRFTVFWKATALRSDLSSRLELLSGQNCYSSLQNNSITSRQASTSDFLKY